MRTNEVLRELRHSSGLSQVETAEFLTARGSAVTQRAVSKWELGSTQPSTEQFLLLCELYRVRDVLEVFRGKSGLLGGLNAAGRQRALEYVRLLEGSAEFALQQQVRQRTQARMIPLYDLPVSAGTGQFLDSAEYELIEADDTVPPTATFAVRVSGDSMTPRFVDRQIVYVRQQQTLKRGECGIFLLNGDAYCKLLTGEKGPELKSINPKYSPIRVGDADEFRVLGKVVG